jgi:hypothetical protein
MTLFDGRTFRAVKTTANSGLEQDTGVPVEVTAD